MALLPDPVDYTSKDFDALRARLIALVKSVFPDWTDFEVAVGSPAEPPRASVRRAVALFVDRRRDCPLPAPARVHPAFFAPERRSPLGSRLGGFC